MTTPEELDALQEPFASMPIPGAPMSDADCIWRAKEIEKNEWHPNHSQNELARTLREVVSLRARVAELEAEVHVLQEAVNAEEERANDANTRAEAAEAELSRRRQGAQVKPLVWPDFREGGTCGRPHHFQYFVTQDRHGVFWAHFDMSQHRTLEAAQQHCERHYQRAALVSPGDGWRSMDSAPKDGRMLTLLVDYSTGSAPLDDAMVAATIGFNSFTDTGEDVWQFAGWNWCQDQFCEGDGVVIGWAEFSPPATPASEGTDHG